MKPGQSTFEERLGRINTGRAQNASDVVVEKPKLVHQAYKGRRFHLDVLVAPEFLRQYSMSGDPAERMTYQIGVLREDQGRGGSALLHDGVREGDVLAIIE